MPKISREVFERMQAKPCPFCNSKLLDLMDVQGHISKTDKRYWVWCKKCGCSGPVEPTAPLAVKLWNKATRRM